MKAISKLKDDARRHELKEEWEKAIQTYLHALRAGEDGEGELELPLYNRVGDLYLRLGRPNDAVTYYEQAADRYAESGLYNNAIALCNKAIRYRPDNLGLLRKLGEFSASQGFIIDARRYFLEYAEKQFAAGAADEAISALKSFADVADDPEILELLGQRLSARGRSADAIEELQKAHRLFVREGKDDRAATVLAEMRSIDPNAAVGSGDAGEIQADPAEYANVDDAGDELPQLQDFDFSVDPTPASSAGAAADAADAAAVAPLDDLMPASPAEGVNEPSLPADDPTAHPTRTSGADMADDGPGDPADDLSALDGLEITDFTNDIDPGAIDVIEGLEATALDFGDVDLDLEATDFGLELERDETSFGADAPEMASASDPVADEAEEALRLPSIWDEDEPPSFADDDVSDTADAAFDLPMLDDGDAAAPSALPMPDDDGFADAAFTMPAPYDAQYGDDEDIDDVDDVDDVPLPLLGDDEASADPAPPMESSEPHGDSADEGMDFELATFTGDDDGAVAGHSAQPVEDLLPGDDEQAGAAPPPFEFADADSAPAASEAAAEGNDVVSEPGATLEPAAPPEPEIRAGDALFPAQLRDEESTAVEWVPDAADDAGAGEAMDEDYGGPLAWDGEFADAASPDGAGLTFEDLGGEIRVPPMAPEPMDEPPAELPGEPADRETAPESYRSEPAEPELSPESAALPETASAAPDLPDLRDLPDLPDPNVDRPDARADEPLPWANGPDAGADEPVADDALAEEAGADTALADSAVADMGGAAEAGADDTVADEAVAGEGARTADGGASHAGAPPMGPPADDGFVDLGAMLADDVEETTRFRVQEKSPTGDEDRDFAELLNQFKEKVSAHVPAEDAAAHYDLGLAFKEMGLVDEAITEFQIALRTGPMRLKVYEELGDCFLQKGQFNIAEKVLRRALDARPEDEHDLLGIYYHLGRAYEGLGRRDEARDAYERVLGLDISFRDVAQRLSRL